MRQRKAKRNPLIPLMNEGLGELMCRRHFFIVIWLLSLKHQKERTHYYEYSHKTGDKELSQKPYFVVGYGFYPNRASSDFKPISAITLFCIRTRNTGS
jgi:hypothetical protein